MGASSTQFFAVGSCRTYLIGALSTPWYKQCAMRTLKIRNMHIRPCILHILENRHLAKIVKTDTSECWQCASGEPQSRHHLFTRCQAWVPQARKMWKGIRKACEWKHYALPL